MRAKEPDLNRWLSPGRTKPETDLANRYERGLLQVAGYIEHARQSKLVPLEWLPGEPASEVPFDIMMGDVQVIGFIDLILIAPDGRLLVRDIKTGNKKPIGPLQLALYGHAVYDLLGEQPEWGDYYMAKNHAPSDPMDLRPYSRDMVAEWFRAMHDSEMRGNYLPNPGDHCTTCGVRRFCSAMGTDRSFFGPEFATRK